MAIKVIEEDGKKLYRMYVQARAYVGHQRSKRLQKYLTFKTETEAKKAERFWSKELIRQAQKLEGKGLTFEEIVDRFMAQARYGYLGRKVNEKTLKEHESRIRRFCRHWYKRPASELDRGDGREVLRKIKLDGQSVCSQQKLKASINMIYDWAIEEKLVPGVRNSPVFGLNIERDEENEKISPILSLDEVKLLLRKARESDHPWYPIWAFAVMTGMRSGELFALKWSSIDLDQEIIRVKESYSFGLKTTKSTKAGYWRNVPISKQLMTVIEQLKPITGNTPYVLPREFGWDHGEAAKILRKFLCSIGVKTPIVFHTLRACFATHLLSSGVEPAKIMKIGGWKSLKTFEIYVRLAGVQVKGVTDKLGEQLF